METKKQYIAPTLKCVEVKVEQGYAMSLTQKLIPQDQLPTAQQEPSNRFGYTLTGNNSDWD